ncbi:MAG: lipid A biosynthesis acyltransferase [Bacteroidetes bacterium]|nr:MAG: lipid A biosynthesis acyltransferase [Bacteroidota bacterium]
MYYLLYGILYLLSLLPMAILYLICDAIYIVLYYGIGYRRRVTMDNLATAFPNKTEEERVAIAKSFYRNFIDNFIETIKLFSASRSFIEARFQVDNPEMYHQFYEAGRKCQLHLGHTFNWEYANIALPFHTKYKFIVVYMPIKNKAFDRIFIRLRSRTGTILLPATEMSRSIIPYRNDLYLLTLVADQAPGNPGNSYWLNFFGCPTPFLKGPERGARAGNIPVIFPYFYKTKRGYYRATLFLGSDNPAQLEEGELTRKYVELLEKNIQEHPGIYLWSHRRWKHAWNNEYANLWIDKNPRNQQL